MPLGVTCCVVGCSNSSRNTTDVKMYSFPSRKWDKEWKEKWIHAVNRKNKDGSKWIPTKNSIICSMHFQGNKNVNHPDSPSYIPTIFPKEYNKKVPNSDQNVKRFQRAMQRSSVNNKISGSETANKRKSNSRDAGAGESKRRKPSKVPCTSLPHLGAVPAAKGTSHLTEDLQNFQTEFIDTGTLYEFKVEDFGSGSVMQACKDKPQGRAAARTQGQRAGRELANDKPCKENREDIQASDAESSSSELPLSTLCIGLNRTTIKLEPDLNSAASETLAFANTEPNPNKSPTTLLNSLCNETSVTSQALHLKNNNSEKNNSVVKQTDKNVNLIPADVNTVILKSNRKCYAGANKTVSAKNKPDINTIGATNTSVKIAATEIRDVNIIAVLNAGMARSCNVMNAATHVNQYKEYNLPEEVEYFPLEILNESCEEFDGEDSPSSEPVWDMHGPQTADRCRVCAKTKDAMLDQREQSHLVEKLLKHLGIDLSTDEEGLPRSVCCDCAETLGAWHALTQTAARGGETLRQMLQQEREQRDKYLRCPSPQELPSRNAELNTDTIRSECSGTTLYRCFICPEVFLRSHDLRKHSHTVHLDIYNNWGTNVAPPPPPPHLCCSLCPLSLDTRASLMNHYRARHNKQGCKICFDWFDTELDLKIHIHEIHKIKCPFCEHKEFKHYHLKQHIQLKHKDLKPKKLKAKAPFEKVYCKICKIKMSSKSSLVSHYFWSHWKFACELCLEFLPTLEEQIEHLEEVHMIPCELCNGKFYSSRRLKTHINKEHKERSSKILPIPKTESQIYECKTCKKGLSTQIFVKRHNFWSHKMYTCDFCLKEFKSADLEEEHYRDAHTKCIFCKKTSLTSFDSLCNHLARKHPDVKPFSCENCGQSFINRQELNAHKTEHKESKNHLCDKCGASFYLMDYLTLHKYTHLSESEKGKVDCNICNKKFVFLSQLKKHMLLHTREQSYKCLDCIKTFATASSLKIHMLKYHITNHKCIYCTMEFIDKNNLHGHIKAIHSNNDLFKCSLCFKIFKTEKDTSFHLSFHSLSELSELDIPFVRISTLQCDFCDNIFSNKSRICYHVKQHLKQL